jgi:hypothetical protein
MFQIAGGIILAVLFFAFLPLILVGAAYVFSAALVIGVVGLFVYANVAIVQEMLTFQNTSDLIFGWGLFVGFWAFLIYLVVAARREAQQRAIADGSLVITPDPGKVRLAALRRLPPLRVPTLIGSAVAGLTLAAMPAVLASIATTPAETYSLALAAAVVFGLVTWRSYVAAMRRAASQPEKAEEMVDTE